MWDWGPTSFFCIRKYSCLSPICWRDYLYTGWRSCQNSTGVRWMNLLLDPQFYSNGLSVLMHLPHCFDYGSSVVSFEVWKCESSNSILLFQDCLAIWDPLQFQKNLRIGFPIFAKKSVWVFTGITLNLQSVLGTYILILRFSIHKHGVFPFIQVYFILLQQFSIISGIQIFHLFG